MKLMHKLMSVIDFSLLVSLANMLLLVPSRRFRRFVVQHFLRWDIGDDVWIGRGLRVLTFGGVVLGSRVVVNRRSELDGRGGLVIGDDVAIAPEVCILTADHDPDSPTREYRERGVTVGDRVWLATGATVLPGARIGEGVVVGARAVVHGSLTPWRIYSGNPAVAGRARDRGAQKRLHAQMPRGI